MKLAGTRVLLAARPGNRHRHERRQAPEACRQARIRRPGPVRALPASARRRRLAADLLPHERRISRSPARATSTPTRCSPSWPTNWSPRTAASGCSCRPASPPTRRPRISSRRSPKRTGSSGLYDFENRTKKFFPDVDDRFKFCILNFGGEAS